MSGNKIGSAGLIERCQIASKQAMGALGAALKTNTSLMELNLSNCNLSGSDITGFAGDIKDNGTLSIFNISNNQLAQGEIDYESGGYKTDMSGLIALAEALKKVSRPFIVDALVCLFLILRCFRTTGRCPR